MLRDKLTNALVRFERIGLPKLDRVKWPHVEPRTVQLTNAIAGLSALISLSQSLAEFMEGAYFYAVSDLIGGLLILCTVGMNALGFFRFSRVFVLLALNLDIHYFNIISGFTTGLELLYFTLVLMPFFLFSSRELVWLVSMTVVPFTLFFVSRFWPDRLFVPLHYIQEAPRWYAMAVPLVAFGTTFFVIYRFLRINEEMHVRLLHHSKFASLGEFAAGISHEINNPLTAITLNTQSVRQALAKHPDLPPTMDSKLEVVERASLRAADIIHGLRLFSRDASGDPHVEMDVAECIRETLALCEQRFREGNIRFEAHVADGVRIFGNPTQISQVLVNLLNNAFDAVQAVDDRWVRLSAEVHGTDLEVRVTNSGPAIQKKDIPKLMEPFFTTKPVGKGTGLGLSIAKGIMEAHRGELRIDTEAKHTTFVIRVPLLQRRA